nr:hypothetical protein [uncultured Flavobacterium sp.]
MDTIKQLISVKNHPIDIILSSDFITDEVVITIPDWQINEVREKTTEYLKDPSIAQDFFDAMKEIEDEL